VRDRDDDGRRRRRRGRSRCALRGARARYDNQTDPLINNDETSARGSGVGVCRRRVVINGSNAAAAAEKGMQILYIHCRYYYYYYYIISEGAEGEATVDGRVFRETT